MLIYSTRYVHSQSIKLVILHYDELIGKLKEYGEITYLMVDDYMLIKYQTQLKK